MIRRGSVILLTLVAMLSAMSIVCQAETQSLLTRHTPEVTLNGVAESVGRLPATQSMHLTLVLALRHQPELENFLQELYDPSSPSYRHFLTVEEFTARFGPSQEDYDALIAFAKASGFTVVSGSRNRMNVQITGSVATIERAFHVTMGVYQHPTENRTFYAPDREPTVDLPFQLRHISGLDNYTIPRPLFQRRNFKAQPEAQTGSCPEQSFCGSDMRAAYYEGTALTGAGQSLGLLEYAGTDLADLNTYYKNAGQTLYVPITLLSTDGTPTSCTEPSCDDTEQTLDMTQALGMAPNMSSLVMYVGSSDTAILNAMATASPLNAQLSSSWVWGADPGTDDPYFEEFAAQGQNFFQASGDGGGYTENALWPSNAAYITSVGGTDLTTTGPGGDWASETVWEDGGGGWGRNVALPAWQVAAAAICASEGGECSQTYRDVPDVAANANFTFYVCADQTTCTANEYGGTSFATPMWAGYLALVNEQGAENGNPPLGFINPALNAIGLGPNYAADFHDITSSANGSNGFPCVTGYNMCGGWGSPNDSGLINGLTTPSFTLAANPNSVTITQGSQGTSTITITPLNGFSGSVTFSASGLPSGVTAAFNPNPATGTSTLTLSASATAATGTVTVMIVGTSGTVTGTVGLTLTVNALVQSFTLTASPNALAIARGGASGTSTITITPVNGFSGSVTLAASGLPKGVTASFSPNPATSTSTLTLTASKTAKVGQATVTIKGTSGSLSATTTLALTVNVLGNFSLTATPSTLTVAKGSSGTSTITVVPSSGFDQEVTLSASGMPSGITASFNTNPTTSTSTLTLTVSGSAPTGKSTITVTGTFGSLTHKVKIKLTVTS